MAGRRRADQAAAVRRTLPRDVLRRPRPVRGVGHPLLRPAQQEERQQRAVLRRHDGHGDSRSQGGARRVRTPPTSSAWAWTTRLGGAQLPCDHRAGRFLVVLGGQHQHVRLPDADRRQRQPADQVRQSRADRQIRQADAGRPVHRDHGPVRAAGRVVAGRHRHPRRAAGRRHLPVVRLEDVDIGRRARDVGEHRASGARQDSRRTARHQGHLAVRRAEVPRRRRRVGRAAQRRRDLRSQPQDGPARHHQHGAQLRTGRSDIWSANRTAASSTCST